MDADPPRRARGLGAGLTVRRAAERGHTGSEWLDSRHTFAFGTYDRVWSGLGALKVLNEDVIAPGRGFGLHPHWDMEILTWVLAGTLRHEDTLGARSLVRAGEAQRVSAGTGLEHSEHNASTTEPVRLFQVWIVPAHKGLAPGHEHAVVPVDPAAPLTLLAAPPGQGGALAVHQDVRVWAGHLGAGAAIEHRFAAGRRAWLQLADGRLGVDAGPGPGAVTLDAGDGVAVIGAAGVRLEAGAAAAGGARFLLFDLA